MADIAKGTNGGLKQHFLRVHRQEILDYAAKYGEESAQLKYNIKKPTWDNFVSNNRRVVSSKVTKSDRALMRAEVAEQGLRDVRRDVRELKEMYSQFVPFLASELTSKFFLPLLASKVELPAELEVKNEPSPLDITNFKPELGKRG